MKRARWLVVVLMTVLLTACQNQLYEKPQSFASVTGLKEAQIGYLSIAYDRYQGAVTVAAPQDLQTLYAAMDGVRYAKSRQQPTHPPDLGGLTLRIVSTIDKIVTLVPATAGRLYIDGVEYYTVTRDDRPTVVDSGLSQKALAIGDELYQRLTAAVAKTPPWPVSEYPDVPEVQITISSQRKTVATLKPGGTVKVPLAATGRSFEVEIVFPRAFDIKSMTYPIKITSEIWRFAMNSGFADWADTNGRNLFRFGLVPWSGFEGEPPKDKPLTVPIKVNIEGVKDQDGRPYPLEFTLNPY